MPDLTFHISGVRAAESGMTPLLIFELQIENLPEEEAIQSILLQTQIRIEPTRRRYDAVSRERLSELFGAPEDWGRTLRDLLWTSVSTTVTGFSGSTSAELAVPCTFDLNVASAKYFYNLDDGDIPLIFLFTGTVFYSSGGRLLVQRVSWESECRHRLPVDQWRELMDAHYPNAAWIYLDRDVFDRLRDFKRSKGLTSWDEALSRLLDAREEQEVTA